MFMVKKNQPIKVINLQKLANQSMLNGALVVEVVSSSFCESKKNFGRMKNIFPVKFIKFLSYLEVQKNSKVVDV